MTVALLRCQNALLTAFYLHNILNGIACYFVSGGGVCWLKGYTKWQCHDSLVSVIISQQVVRPLWYLGLYLTGEQLGTLSTTMLLLKPVL